MVSPDWITRNAVLGRSDIQLVRIEPFVPLRAIEIQSEVSMLDLLCAEARIAEHRMHDGEPNGRSAVTHTYEWIGAEDLPVWVSRQMESELHRLPWRLVKIGESRECGGAEQSIAGLYMRVDALVRLLASEAPSCVGSLNDFGGAGDGD